ncbi:hypothetical protein [Thalassospira marina]|uniref:Uncharacterized protein n=1 Tax=Thalassospira marina TaxID=2048283 RepID=A0ABN5FTX5_9PROT|nr:hypothetical protein [Thalassospira marina]AUG55285.1 hypothetical protein CSC3H3_20600 [Thalassospira marina]
MHTVTECDIHIAKQIAREFDAAIRANENDAAQNAAQDFRALSVSANGDRGEFGIFGPDGAGTVMIAALAAKDGDVPHWGQNGLFVLETDHGRVLVGFACPLDICSRFEFNAIDLDLPFISETGFQSHFYSEWPPMSVKDAAAIIFCQYATVGKMMNINPEYCQTRLERMPDFIQISSSDFQGVLTKTDSTGQIGFQF